MSRTSAKLYRAAFHEAPDGTVLVDGGGVIRELNRKTGELFGYSRDELLGERVEILLPEGVRSRHRNLRDGYMQDPHARPMGIDMELRGRRRDGTEFPVEISLSPIEVDDETFVLASVRDLTRRKRLRDFSSGALRASEEERQRIARELHDDTAQHLATLLVRLRILEQAGYEAEWEEAIQNVREELKACAEGVRRIARGLRPPELEDAGLIAAIRAHVRSLAESVRAEIALDADPVDPVLSPDRKLVLYRIVQEALSNAVRHSGGSVVRIGLRREGDKVLAVIEDDGEGFRPDRVVSEVSGGLGLVGMQERAVMVGGRVRIESRPGEGTRIEATIPAESKEREVQRV